MKKRTFAQSLSKKLAMPTEKDLSTYFYQQSIKRQISLKGKLSKKR